MVVVRRARVTKLVASVSLPKQTATEYCRFISSDFLHRLRGSCEHMQGFLGRCTNSQDFVSGGNRLLPRFDSRNSVHFVKTCSHRCEEQEQFVHSGLRCSLPSASFPDPWTRYMTREVTNLCAPHGSYLFQRFLHPSFRTNANDD